ncbi:hypothetical protein [uncultured Mediterranean phage uvMED]|nr:hypothetical protein [uncultured Mediterranean phage uvMED]
MTDLETLYLMTDLETLHFCSFLITVTAMISLLLFTQYLNIKHQLKLKKIYENITTSKKRTTDPI